MPTASQRSVLLVSVLLATVDGTRKRTYIHPEVEDGFAGRRRMCDNPNHFGDSTPAMGVVFGSSDPMGANSPDSFLTVDARSSQTCPLLPLL